MEEANLLWYGTHIKVVLEIPDAVEDMVPRPVAIVNPETNEYVLNYNEFYPYGIIPSVTAYKATPTSPVKIKTTMVNKYHRLPEYLFEKYGMTVEELDSIVSDKINNPDLESDLEASEEFYRSGLVKVKK